MPLNELAPHDTLIRCKKALAVWEKGDYDLIITTGGIFMLPCVQTVPVAELMRQWFLSKGIPADRVVSLTNSVDTFTDISAVMNAVDKNIDITVLSHWQHVIRATATFFLARHTLVRPYPIFYWKGWKDFLKECFFILYHLIDWRGKGNLARKNRVERKKDAAS